MREACKNYALSHTCCISLSETGKNFKAEWKISSIWPLLMLVSFDWLVQSSSVYKSLWHHGFYLVTQFVHMYVQNRHTIKKACEKLSTYRHTSVTNIKTCMLELLQVANFFKKNRETLSAPISFCGNFCSEHASRKKSILGCTPYHCHLTIFPP